MLQWLVALSLFICLKLPAEESPPACQISESFSETNHTITIQGKPLNYKATAGNLILRDCQSKDSASMFFVAYTKEGAADQNTRPITFCFNGGPGSASVWLNIGAFGPR